MFIFFYFPSCGPAAAKWRMEERREHGERKRKKKGGIETKGKTKKLLMASGFRSGLQQEAADGRTVFALIVAALSRNSHKPLIRRCLNQLLLSLLSTNPNPSSIIPPDQILPVPILSLLPVLLRSKYADIVSDCAAIVGAASLFSFQMNEQIASDDQIVKGLVFALASSQRKASLAACNAILDLSTTSAGRERLLQFSALEILIFCLLQAPKSSTALISLFTEGKGNEICPKIGFKEDELPVLLLDAAITLINSCKIEQLEKIPRKLSETLLVYLKKTWTKVREQMILGTNSAFIQEEHFYISNIRANNLAESIFKLSINAGPTPLDFKMVKGSIFGQSESSFKHFVLNHWEVSPFLIRRLSDTLTRQDDVFNLFIQSLNSKEDAPSFLFSKFQNLVSCPPIAADEIDILCFLKEVRNHLGFPIIYQQDIRVLKTQQSKEEVHFFQEDSGSCSPHAPQFLYADNILRCEEAYKKGYTVALRGVEFRFRSIAAIVEGLASMFGQPLAGANIYLTPPRSQGLARHCDDHCVIVCQLFGMKQWTIFPCLTHQLPRLYEPIGNWHDLEAKSSTTDGCKQFLLKEGDFLYIPRGFPHEACTIADNNEFDDNAGFSLHLTLSIEVEPPFEWQGFAHVALHHWAQKDQNCYTSSDPLSLNLNVISVNLLHVAIKLIGDYDATFRKACLVASSLWPSDTNDWLDMNQRTIFSYLIDKINSESRFSDALSWIEMDIQTNEDPLQQIRWLRYLNNGGGSSCVHNWCSHSVGIETFFQACYQHKDEVEAAFIQVKSEFCSEVIFEDVEPSYRLLLEKYKKARKQYMNGMLALHCN